MQGQESKPALLAIGHGAESTPQPQGVKPPTVRAGAGEDGLPSQAGIMVQLLPRHPAQLAERAEDCALLVRLESEELLVNLTAPPDVSS